MMKRVLFILLLISCATTVQAGEFWEPCPGAGDWKPGDDWPHINVTNWLPIPIYWSSPSNDGPVMLEPGQGMAQNCDVPVQCEIECSINAVRGTLTVTGENGGIRFEFEAYPTPALPTTWGLLKSHY